MAKPVGLALWGTEPIRTTVEHVRRAEAAGFENVWLVDSQLTCRELHVTLAAAAVATRRIRLATGVTVPRIRHASVTASALATLDELSGGRAMAGVSLGHSALRNIGEQPARIAELRGYVRDVRDLLAGREVRFESGTEGALRWMPQPAAVPLHVAATGPKLTAAAAGMADGVILLQGAAPDLLAAGVDRVEVGLAAAGRTRAEIEITAWIYVGLDDDAAAARDQVRARVAAVLRMMDPARFEGADREAVERLRRAYDMFAHADSTPAHAALAPDHLIDRFAVAGAPDAVRARIQEILADPRIDRVVVSPQIGGPNLPITAEFIRRFGETVLTQI